MQLTHTVNYPPFKPGTDQLQPTSLSIGSVVQFEIADNQLNLTEMCDWYHSVNLDKPNAQILVDHLQSLVDQLS